MITRDVLGIGLFMIALTSAAFGQAPRAPAGAGTVRGVVRDSETGEVIRGATVEVSGHSLKMVTDIDGLYSFTLAAGLYELDVSKENYFDQPVKGIEVSANSRQDVDIVLVPKNVVSDLVTVEAESAAAATARAVLLDRKAAGVIQDNISAEDMGRNPDSDAASVLERMTGVSVVQDKYVYVRGLGERYSNTMLNGSVLASTEPERKVVPFDLFPAALIDRIITLKTFTPDQPGDFSGGLVKIETIQFPNEFKLKYSVGVQYDTNVSTRHFLGYPGGDWDWLGYGGRARRLPDNLPAERISRRSAVTGKGYTADQLQEFGRSLSNTWEPRSEHALPNHATSIMGGGTFGKLGTVFAVNYSRKFSRLNETMNTYQPLNNGLLPWDRFNNDRNTQTVKLGLVGNMAYKLTGNHKLLFRNFYTRDASDETRLLEGYSAGNTADERDMRLRYVEESLYTGQVSGEHYLTAVSNSLLEWRMSYSRGIRREPDLRENVYRSERGMEQYSWSSQGQSGFRQFSGQFDDIYEPGVDWTFFMARKGIVGSYKFGGLWQERERDFSSRRFAFLPNGRTLDFAASPETLFAPANINPNGLELREVTRPTDTFDGQQSVQAGYAMADLTLGDKWRLTGGVRVERSHQRLVTYDPFAAGLNPISTDLQNTDPLPSINLGYQLAPDMILRFGYSRSLNRPEFRELAPFQFTDISGRSTIQGNPDLRRSNIDNLDLRWEQFGADGSLFAASVFWKNFNDPIERVLYYAADLLTSFSNIDQARNKGFELEARKSLVFISPRLTNWNLYANYSRIGSTVNIGNVPGIVVTSAHRPLQGQAKYLFNSVLEYNSSALNSNVRLLYNLVGPRISDVGATGLPDVYEQPNHFVDVSVVQGFEALPKVKFKFSIQNLLNRAITHLQGSEVFLQYKPGRIYGISLSYDLY